MKKYLKKLSFLNNTVNKLAHNYRFATDSLALIQIRPFLDNYPFIPFNEKALRPIVLNHAINEVFINGRSNVLEVGAGMSTIVLARALEKNKRGSIISIEQDLTWATFINKRLGEEGLSNIAKCYYVPVEKAQYFNHTITTFNKEKIAETIENKQFDLILIDGPKAYGKGQSYNRISDVFLAKQYLNENTCIILDDAGRSGEKAAIKYWEEKYGLKFFVHHYQYALAYTKNSFSCIPF